MKDASKHYDMLTTHERLTLTIEALARGDDVDSSRLIASCPTKSYTMHDAEFSVMLTRLKTIALLILLNAYQANARANAALVALAMDNQNALAMYNFCMTNQLSIQEAWRRFCVSIDLDPDKVLAAFALGCPDLLGPVLDKSIKADEQAVSLLYEQFHETWASQV